MTAHDDRARDEQLPEIRTEDDAMRYLYGGVYGTGMVGQPAPTARETAADELAEAHPMDVDTALRMVQLGAPMPEEVHRLVERTLVAVLDERGRERDAARAEADSLGQAVGRLREAHRELLDAGAARNAELEQLRMQLTRAQALSSADPAAVRELRDENARLRARLTELEPIEQRVRLSATREQGHRESPADYRRTRKLARFFLGEEA
jgi:hypothetical protein